jgi:hypothetical protein
MGLFRGWEAERLGDDLNTEDDRHWLKTGRSARQGCAHRRRAGHAAADRRR